MIASETPATPESRGARSLTDRSLSDRSPGEEILTNDTQTHPEFATGPRVWPRVVGVLILLLGAGGAWVWQNPGPVQHALAPLLPGSGGNDMAESALKALEARVARLEQRPAPADLGPQLGPLAARLDALEKRPPPPGQQVDLRPLLARLDALEARGSRDAATGAPPNAGPSVSPTVAAIPALIPLDLELRPFIARLEALEKSSAEHAGDPGKVAAISSRMEALSAHDPAAELRARLDEAEHQLSALAAKHAGVAEVSDRTARLARLEAAGIALAAGHALGVIQDAPPALARFATTAPPTEAAGHGGKTVPRSRSGAATGLPADHCAGGRSCPDR
jgi:hypothetical protein